MSESETQFGDLRRTAFGRLTEFGDYVQRRRVALGLGLRDFARAIGSRPSLVAAIEHGRRPAPDDASLIKWADVLEIGVATSEWHELCAIVGRTNERVPAAGAPGQEKGDGK